LGYIVEEEQRGGNREEYGKELLTHLRILAYLLKKSCPREILLILVRFNQSNDVGDKVELVPSFKT
jgi:hypothetical protein